jgi:sugar/nucleoside kinase (ribokinase family)
LKPHFDVLVPGSYFCDVIFTGLTTLPALGTEIYGSDVAVVPGGALNTVIALHRLGLRVGWAGIVGSDFFSRYALEHAQREGIDTSLLIKSEQPIRRVTVALSYPQDRAFVTYADPISAALELAFDVIERITFSHLHYGGLVVHDEIPALIAGFIAASLQRRPLEECLAWGNYCGGVSTLGLGGASNAPTHTQLEKWLAENKER